MFFFNNNDKRKVVYRKKFQINTKFYLNTSQVKLNLYEVNLGLPVKGIKLLFLI